ncbi:nucleoside-diphosphate sugar epimerase [Kribbella sp. ALI-6-A]|uniref:NmrA/HSCARG family protein n=1 Tax=Kribbella sp. ALI-6-A TaxID=1933817 RepID=UPI00097C4012|nr:NmrA/HSCARG family protein [Kribbella sp. ALI-6-A]ONI75529.1 nucleoside-diphosphate sugar epimerase [Kribbella sp. ALI-6-A]
MTEQKLIAVVGATGSQGGGLVRAILADGGREYGVRALTRDPESASARALAEAGAEVVAADLDDEASVRKAFEGAYGAFVVTNYWAPMTPEQEAARSRAEMELEQAGNAARAARDAGLRHVIWSTLEDTRRHFGDDDRVPSLDDGRFKVPHFDAKGEANELFTQYGVPTTFLQTTFFYEAFTMGIWPTRNADGVLELTLPMNEEPLSGIASEDIGRTAYGIFKRGSEFVGRTVSIAGDHLTGKEYAAVLAEALGEPVVYRPYSWDEFRQSGFPGAVETGNMFQFYAEDSERFTGDRDLKLVRELNPELLSFKEWAEANKGRISR